jgi:hypothetical protein
MCQLSLVISQCYSTALVRYRMSALRAYKWTVRKWRNLLFDRWKYLYVCIYIYIYNQNVHVVVSLAVQPSAGYGLVVPWGFVITHNFAPQSVGLLWTSDQLVAENTQHTQQTNIHAPGGIRTHDRSWRAAVDLRRRLRGHSDRLPKYK